MKSSASYRFAAALALCTLTSLPSRALPAPQTQDAQESAIVVEPLFDYPAPPEEVENLKERSEWVLAHFWEPMDFKKKSAVDQNALNHAFGIYTLAMQWASPQAVDKSVASLLKSLSKNPALTLQFTKAAEENLYGPRAPFWGDAIYADFLRSAVSNKKIGASRREKFAAKLKKIESSQKGAKAPAFTFTRPDGSEARYFPMATPTMIVFGNPDNPDIRLARLRMDTNITFSRLLKGGKANVLFILPGEAPEDWGKTASDCPAEMTVGASGEAAERYDLKISPSCYVIDANGKIAAGNIDMDTAVITLAGLAE
ncbi:MAG: DUF5106 domain-containing protein [Muribaculaceae bacterium]|nr:DUF5106 domain-containing protein [Muribaculaceae bacterium]